MDAWLVVRCHEEGSEVIGRYDTDAEATAAAASHPQRPNETVFAAPARRLAPRILDTEE